MTSEIVDFSWAAHIADVRLVASDLDGTLLRRDGTVSARTARVVEHVAGLGIDVVLVTARPPRWTREIACSLHCHPLAVCSNGGLVYDFVEDAVVLEHPIPREAALEIVRRVRRVVVGAAIAVESKEGTGFEPHYSGTWTARGDALVAQAEVLLERPVCKLAVRHAEVGDHWSVVERVREVVGDLGEVTSSGPDAPVEVAAPGVSKAVALEVVAEKLGLAASQAIAFGDMPNDLPMLAWAGTSVAPLDAHPDVLTAVDRVTEPCDRDGVAAVLEVVATSRRRRRGRGR